MRTMISSVNVNVIILPLIVLYVNHVHSRSLRDRRALSYIANQTVCMVDKVIYRDGDPIPTDDPCETCKCRPPGFSCVLRECEVKPGCKAIRREGECCPEYQCGCEHNGKLFTDGERIPYAESPCYTCYCQGSSITCGLADCKFRFDCEPEYHHGDCCPRYNHCPPEPTPSTTSTTIASTFATMSNVTFEASTLSVSTDAVSVTTQSTVDSGESTLSMNSTVGTSSDSTTVQAITTPLSTSTQAPSSSEINDSSVSDATVSPAREEEVNEIIISSTSTSPSLDATSSNYPSEVTSQSIVSEVVTNSPMTTVDSNKLTESPINQVNFSDTTETLSSSTSPSPAASSSSPSSSSTSWSVLSPGGEDTATTLPSLSVKELVKGQQQGNSMTVMTTITSSSPPSSVSASSPSSLATTVSDDNSQDATEVSNILSTSSAPADAVTEVTTQISQSQPQKQSALASADSSSVTTSSITDDMLSPQATSEEVSPVTIVNLVTDDTTTDYPTTKVWIPDSALVQEHRESPPSSPNANGTINSSIESIEVTNTPTPEVASPSTASLENLSTSVPVTTLASVTDEKDEVVDITTQSIISSTGVPQVETTSAP